MSNNQEQFDLAPQIEEAMNTFRVIHVYNQSNKYHLTRQVLLDSILTQNTYCFFYHMLSMGMEQFNELYGSFACLIERNPIEADIYLNVDPDALCHIIKYIQTRKIDGREIYRQNWRIIDEIIDLATMFGMPNLVAMLRDLHPSEEEINASLEHIKCLWYYISLLYKGCVPDHDVEGSKIKIDEFIDNNKQLIADDCVKNTMYSNSILYWIHMILDVFIIPELSNFDSTLCSDSTVQNLVRPLFDVAKNHKD